MWPEERPQVCASVSPEGSEHRARSGLGPLFTSYSEPAFHTDSLPCGQSVAEMPGVSSQEPSRTQGLEQSLVTLDDPGPKSWGEEGSCLCGGPTLAHLVTWPPNQGPRANLALSEAAPAGLCLSGGWTPACPPQTPSPPRLWCKVEVQGRGGEDTPERLLGRETPLTSSATWPGSF